jgi:hypothetical protein
MDKLDWNQELSAFNDKWFKELNYIEENCLMFCIQYRRLFVPLEKKLQALSAFIVFLYNTYKLML